MAIDNKAVDFVPTLVAAGAISVGTGEPLAGLVVFATVAATALLSPVIGKAAIPAVVKFNAAVNEARDELITYRDAQSEIINAHLKSWGLPTFPTRKPPEQSPPVATL